MPLAELKPHPKNPRKHPEPDSPEWIALRASLEDDYFDPLVWNETNGRLVSGHLRARILHEAGYILAEVVVKSYTEATHLARMIAANHQAGRDHKGKLQDIARELDQAGAGLTLTALTEIDTEKYLRDNPAAALTEAIRDESEQPPAEKLAGEITGRLTEKIYAAADQDPDRFARAQAIILPTDAGRDCLVLADPEFNDLVAELRRYADAGEDSPLSCLMAAHLAL